MRRLFRSDSRLLSTKSARQRSTVTKKINWIDADSYRNPFDGLKREVTFTALDTTDVGAMYVEDVGGVFLAECIFS